MSDPNYQELLQNLRNGDLLAELDEEFAGLVVAVEETAKGGSLTLKISVPPLAKECSPASP